MGIYQLSYQEVNLETYINSVSHHHQENCFIRLTLMQIMQKNVREMLPAFMISQTLNGMILYG